MDTYTINNINGTQVTITINLADGTTVFDTINNMPTSDAATLTTALGEYVKAYKAGKENVQEVVSPEVTDLVGQTLTI